VPLAVSLGLAMAAVGFNIQHDGGHHACSTRPWVNRLMALTMDLVGASSYVWRWKHGVLHHTYVNITGHDDDVNLGPLARLTPHQRRLPFHRFQHWYLWPLYGLFTIKWEFYDDFRDVLTGRLGPLRFPRPRGWDLVAFLGGKAVFFALALAVPLLLHSPWAVLLYYGVVSCILGAVLGVVFQLAHCVEQAAFPLPHAETGRIENAWAVHQVETTVDFAPHSRVAAWLLGGLNFQIEHHLFPRVCHVHYPALAPLVEQTCHEFGLRYSVHETIWAGVASHYRWLRRLGAPEPMSPLATAEPRRPGQPPLSPDATSPEGAQPVCHRSSTHRKEHVMRVVLLGDKVRVHFVKRFQDGCVVSSRGKAPTEVTVGVDHRRLPGLGLALVGLAVGESRTLFVPVRQAYGLYDARRVYRLRRTRFGDQPDLAIGKWVRVWDRRHRRRLVRIVGLREHVVVIDANHRWAGQSLELEVEVMSIHVPNTTSVAANGAQGHTLDTGGDLRKGLGRAGGSQN
jgi:linoleoyl-CoA desaturase